MSQELEYDILEEMQKVNMPIGASYLSLRLTQSQATIGRMLLELEHNGYIVKASNKGRVLTELGRQYYDQLKNKYHFEEFTNGLVNVIATDNEQIYMDILQIRLLLEPPAVRIATGNITPAQIEDMKSVLKLQLEKQSRGELGEAENLEFHTKLARYSGNKVLEQLLKIILLQNKVYMPFSFIQYRVSHGKNEHMQILQAMERQDAASAEELMRQHLLALKA